MNAAKTDTVLDDALDAVCQRGCRYVLQAIAAMQRGEVPDELSGVPAGQHARALDELQAVMAVYDRECSVEPGGGL